MIVDFKFKGGGICVERWEKLGTKLRRVSERWRKLVSLTVN